MPLRVCVYVCVCVCVCVLRVFVTPSTPTLDACMSYEEDTCMSYEEEDTCVYLLLLPHLPSPILV